MTPWQDFGTLQKFAPISYINMLLIDWNYYWFFYVLKNIYLFEWFNFRYLYFFIVYQLTCWINIFFDDLKNIHYGLLIRLLFFIVHHWFCCCKLHQVSHWQYIWQLVMAYVFLCTTNDNQLMKNKKLIMWKLIFHSNENIDIACTLNWIENYNSFKFH